MQPHVEAFFDPASATCSYVVSDSKSGHCAIIDPVLDYEPASGRIHHHSAARLENYIRQRGLQTTWILETHIHADHLSAGKHLQQILGGKLAIGEGITRIQATFGALFHAEPGFATDGSQFDHLFHDAEAFHVGQLAATALSTPGHTPACMSYLIGDALFVGDTLFMPDYGTARCDFPGGDAATLYRSIRKLLALPDSTRVFVCHDYKAPGRDQHAWQSSIAEQRRSNIHIREGISEQAFVTLRQQRDATLAVPALMLPSIQVNMRGGQLPAPESNGTRYLKIPLNIL